MMVRKLNEQRFVPIMQSYMWEWYCTQGTFYLLFQNHEVHSWKLITPPVLHVLGFLDLQLPIWSIKWLKLWWDGLIKRFTGLQSSIWTGAYMYVMLVAILEPTFVYHIQVTSGREEREVHRSKIIPQTVYCQSLFGVFSYLFVIFSGII